MTSYASTKLTAQCYSILLAVCFMSSPLTAGDGTSRYQYGVRNSTEHPLKPRQLLLLLESLRQKSGFLEMHFGDDGFLRLGDRSKIAGGSAIARELLIAAVDRAKGIDLENHEHSLQVAFARLAKPVEYNSKATGARIDIYPIEIDFSDFAHLRGSREVIEAFDIGFVVLHELAHAALGLRDALVNGQEPGECEEYINLIRRELGVPERLSYVAKTFGKPAMAIQKPSQQAELVFAYTTGSTKTKPKLLNLNWEAERVGYVIHTEYKPQTMSPRSQTAVAP
ncbi:MAG TPA: hypothetical protein PLK30_19795 [Blastocatellia bacterium]|nr:hypothetical protein [Blastocatellia bacterium]